MEQVRRFKFFPKREREAMCVLCVREKVLRERERVVFWVWNCSEKWTEFIVGMLYLYVGKAEGAWAPPVLDVDRG